MSVLYDQVDSLGEAILEWADPDNQFRGYTEVSRTQSAKFVCLTLWCSSIESRRRRLMAQFGYKLIQGGDYCYSYHVHNFFTHTLLSLLSLCSHL